MLRALIAFFTLAVLAPRASAQPSNFPLAPGVRPASPFGVGMPTGIGLATTHLGRPGIVYFSAVASRGWANGWSYQTYSPWAGYGYTFGGYLPYGYVVPPVPQQVIVEQPRQPEPTIVLANEFPATLVLQFPAAVDVWLNGKAVYGTAGVEIAIVSPVLKPGERFAFEVRARWTNRGKTYESTETVTLRSGQRSRLFVVSRTEVR